MATGETIAKWRYRLIPDHIIGELLTKDWIDTTIPMVILILSVIGFSLAAPNFLTASSFIELTRQMGEITFVTLGMALVILAGGIDLSVGSTFALANFATLALVNYFKLPIPVAIVCVIAIGAFVGLINGLLVGYLRLRAFLTTLAMLIIIRAIVDYLLFLHGTEIVGSDPDSAFWDFLSFGTIFGFPFNYLSALIVAIGLHIVLTRVRLGWHIRAIGGSRRSAHNAGIHVRRTVCLTYVISGVLTSVAGVLYAARLNNAGTEAGVGMEVAVLTAAVLGGNSLGGGRGSIPKAVLGAFIVGLFTNSLLRFSLPSGANPLAIGLILLLAVAIDVRWLKNRAKLLARVYVSPAYSALGPLPSTDPASGSPYATNAVLRHAQPIGLDAVDGAEDVILDRNNNLYTGSRHGDILRFSGPNFEMQEVFVHIGGHPLGMAFDKDENLIACVAGMGLYKVAPDRTVTKLTDETNRSLFSIIDDSRMRFADDLDITHDGRIFFSEATIRFDIFDWATDALESRGNGRILCYDTRTGTTRTVIPKLNFPNGICMIGDGESFLFAETWSCSIKRYYFEGPKKGKIEMVVENMPGYPDNINRSSDGNFWVAMLGMRAPVLDLALRMPGFRRRMARRVAPDRWLYPNLNTGCIIKFDLSGKILQSLWDITAEDHAMITSMREHRGHLYIGGVYNNRVGRIPLPGADPNWTAYGSYWSGKP
jgi:ribose transport system permease protein